MVEIRSIRTLVCPVCGCQEIVEESVECWNGEIKEHCNGGRWEHRKFACGFHIEYVPNFLRERCLTKCSFDPDELAKKEQERKAKADITNLIETANCPEKFKERLLDAIRYM